MKKRLLSAAMALALALSLLPVSAQAAYYSEAIPYKYDDAESFSEGLAAVRLDGKWSYIDKSGNEVIPCKYNGASSFSEGLAYVRLDGKYGYIDKSGNEAIPCKYDSVFDFHEGFAEVRLDGKWGFIDKSGNEVIPCKYDSASSFSEGLAAVGLDGKWSYIDKSGNEAIPCKYDWASSFSEGLAAVRLDGKYSFIDKSGNEVIPCKDIVASYFSEGLAAVERDGKQGYIDKSGNEVIPCKYDCDVAARPFSEGLASVRLDHKWGYIDKSGNEVIPCKYDWADSFSEGLAAVMLDGKWGYIDKSGNEIVPRKYDYDFFAVFADPFSEGLAPVRLNGKYGFIAVCSVRLALNGGDGSEKAWISDGGTAQVPTNPTRAGYNFAGWYADEALTKPWNFNSAATEDMTLYAKWTPLSSTAETTTERNTGITVNGTPVQLQTYVLPADSNGGDINFVKLRDVAAILDGTGSQCNVDWRNNTIYVENGMPYTTRNGTELKPIVGAGNTYRLNTAPILFDGVTVPLEGIVLTDGNGGGHTFFKLRDLGEAIGFDVDWSAEQGVIITTK